MKPTHTTGAPGSQYTGYASNILYEQKRGDLLHHNKSGVKSPLSLHLSPWLPELANVTIPIPKRLATEQGTCPFDVPITEQ